MTKRLIFPVFALTMFVCGQAYGAASSDNALKNEMRILDGAYKNLITCITLNTPEAIEEPFHKVHAAKPKTEEALEKGKIKLPKNGSKTKQFKEMDEAFHLEIETLIKAAKTKNETSIKESAKRLLDGCVKCHSMFRK